MFNNDFGENILYNDIRKKEATTVKRLSLYIGMQRLIKYQHKDNRYFDLWRLFLCILSYNRKIHVTITSPIIP